MVYVSVHLIWFHFVVCDYHRCMNLCQYGMSQCRTSTQLVILSNKQERLRKFLVQCTLKYHSTWTCSYPPLLAATDLSLCIFLKVPLIYTGLHLSEGQMHIGKGRLYWVVKLVNTKLY
jgi:hypothetical protein